MIPTLPEGARLALLNWPGGQPTWQQIVQAAGPNRAGHGRTFRQCVQPVLDAGLIEEFKIVEGDYPYHKVRSAFRLTQAGRKAVDVLQSAGG
jgi:hypothetical protein